MNNKQLFVIIAFASIVLAGAVIGLAGNFVSASEIQVTNNVISEELEQTPSCGCGSDTCTGSCGGDCDGGCGKTAEEKAAVGGSCGGSESCPAANGGTCTGGGSCGGAGSATCGAAKESGSCGCGK